MDLNEKQTCVRFGVDGTYVRMIDYKHENTRSVGGEIMQAAYSGTANGYRTGSGLGSRVGSGVGSGLMESTPQVQSYRFTNADGEGVRNRFTKGKPSTKAISMRTRSMRRTMAIIVLAIMWAWALFSALHHSAGIASAETTGRPYVVHEGDTLWSIAQKEDTFGVDTRTVVLQIMQFNHMSDAQIQPGETLLLPRGR